MTVADICSGVSVARDPSTCRRMTAAVGHPTLRLVRTAIGPLALGTLAPGAWRDLTARERAALDALASDIGESGRRVVN